MHVELSQVFNRSASVLFRFIVVDHIENLHAGIPRWSSGP
jgi:hypothetical protein